MIITGTSASSMNESKIEASVSPMLESIQDTK